MAARPDPGTRPPSATAAWLTASAGLLVIGVAIWTGIQSDGGGITIDSVLQLMTMVATLLAFVLSGAVIGSRQPGNIVGWLLLVPGIALPLSLIGQDWLSGLEPSPTVVTPLMWVVLWFSGWSWVLLIFPIFHLLLTFPDGRLLSRRWRWVVALEVAMAGFFIFVATFQRQMGLLIDDVPVWTVPNPIGFIGPEVWDAIDGPWNLGLLGLTVAGLAALVLRYRRGTSEQRRRLRWPLAAITFFGVIYGLANVPSGPGETLIWNVLFSVSLAFIPISIAIAVLRYRLYEIDRIVSRTVSWAVVTGLLVTIFAALVVGFQAILEGVTQGQTLAVAGSTLVAAALFNPIRLRVQRVVDRRFNRSKYDAERIVSAFSERLRNEVDLDTLRTDLHATTNRAVEPRTTAIWLRANGPA